jgi:hypothetical protein
VKLRDSTGLRSLVRSIPNVSGELARITQLT